MDYLTGLGLTEPTIRPTGHWWHGFLVAAVTSSLDLAVQKRRHEFIPGHTILARNAAALPVPVGGRQLIPDQLFALKYPDCYRAFLLEFDRGTEPLRSAKHCKSLQRSIKLYREMFVTEAHRRYFGLRANTLVLWVFDAPRRMARFDEIARAEAGEYTGRFLAKVLPGSARWREMAAFQDVPWMSCGGETELVL